VTHEVLPRVEDIESPDGSRDDVGRMMWRLALLPEFCILYLSLYIYMCAECIFVGAS